jgi:sn-1 stearoyl-lipid 9-desaturase
MHSACTELLCFVPDLRRNNFHSWISRWHWLPLVGLTLVLFAIGGFPLVMWGICLRTVIGLHATWLVNSATHMWGSRRFATRDDSRNSFWVAALTFGEGWHNNHHSNPQSARHGLAWYEIDLNWYGISVLRLFGLAWDIKKPSTQPYPSRRTRPPEKARSQTSFSALSAADGRSAPERIVCKRI